MKVIYELCPYEDASELDKLHAALKTKQRQIDNVQQKLKQAGNENLQLSDQLDEQKEKLKETETRLQKRVQQLED